MLTITGIHHVQLAMPAGEEEAAIDFYEGLLGLAYVPKPTSLAERGGCPIRAAAVELHLGVERDFRPARKAHPALLVQGLEAACSDLAAAGLVVTPE